MLSPWVRKERAYEQEKHRQRKSFHHRVINVWMAGRQLTTENYNITDRMKEKGTLKDIDKSRTMQDEAQYGQKCVIAQTAVA